MIPRSFLLEIFIAMRYLRGQGRTVIFSLGTRLSFFFMALMVFIMVLVLSVFNGFQREVHRSLWNSGYHITVARQASGLPIENYSDIIQTLTQKSKTANIRSIFPSITVNALLEVNGRFEGKAIRAIPVTQEELREGYLKDYPKLVHYNQDYLNRFNGENYVVIGREMARYFGWQVGDIITLYLPRGGMMMGQGMQIAKENFKIAGYFRTGYYEYDLNLIFMSLKTAQRILDMPNRTGEIIVQLKNLDDLEEMRKNIRDSLPGNPYYYSIHTIRDEKGNFLAALQLEKTMMIIILGLLILAGVAGIWVTVYLLVQSKSRSIGMLRAMGLPTGSVLMIFTAHSMLIGLLSTAVGGSLGIFIANRLEAILQMVEDMINSVCNGWTGGECSPYHLIPKNIYYFDHLPVYADAGVIFAIAMVTLILSGLAGYFPSKKASLMNPVDTIRND